MAASRTLISIAVAAVIALAAVVFISNSPASEPRTALAGPCGADPLLFFSPIDGPPLDETFLVGAEPGSAYQEKFRIVTDPEELPDGKPPVTISVVEKQPGSGHAGIVTGFNPSESDGSFTTTAVTGIAAGVPAGVYEYEIEIDCHGQITEIPYDVYVGTCPAPSSSGFQMSGISGTPTPSPEPFPETCEEPTPTPTPSPTASPSPTPTAAPGLDATWGDNNCSLQVDPIDSLLVLRGDAGLSSNTGDCPDMGEISHTRAKVVFRQGIQGNGLDLPWGDVDCTGDMSPVDSLKILRHDAGLSVPQEPICFAIGSEVTVTEL